MGVILIGGFALTSDYLDNLYADLLKIDKSGKIVWNTIIASRYGEWINSIVESEDGYIATGVTNSFNEHTGDIYLVKVNKRGELIFRKNFSRGKFSKGETIIKTSDGNFLISGYSKPTDF